MTTAFTNLKSFLNYIKSLQLPPIIQQ
uniref:Uncharacterized protein n=1 Tax=Anguilla anguilla TaxID=7936 RepID=A0A0E9S223_ANGAN